MPSEYIDDQNFSQVNYSKLDIKGIQFEACQFNQCNFAGANLKECFFIGCTFTDCDLSSAKIQQASFQSIDFINCKLMGLDFSSINPFLLSFSAKNSQLNLCSFAHLKMTKTVFTNCQIEEADFWETNLSESKFINCNLNGSQFEQTNLTKADLSSAMNFSINPDSNQIKGAVFSKENLIGLLQKYQIKLNA
jgi:uncharacterized protein YjbI with pentapeptide repeats